LRGSNPGLPEAARGKTELLVTGIPEKALADRRPLEQRRLTRYGTSHGRKKAYQQVTFAQTRVMRRKRPCKTAAFIHAFA